MGEEVYSDKIEKINNKINQLEQRKIRMENRSKNLLDKQDRRERTRRLIQVGAIFEKYFEIEGAEEAEKVALALSEIVKKNKDRILKNK